MTTIDLTARQARALDTLFDLAPSEALSEVQLFARVWGLEMFELELLMDASLVRYYRRGSVVVWWLSAQGRRYARELREARQTSDPTDRCGIAGSALQGAGHAPSRTAS
jgi:hypothetical protein